MTAKTQDRREPGPAFDQLPVRIERCPSLASVVFDLCLLCAMLAGLASIFTVAVAHAVAEPRALAVLSNHPVAAVQGLFGLAVLLAIVVLPVRRLLRRVGARRTVEVHADVVRVSETTLWGTRQWEEPLARYRGVAHHVRASLSGLRHELVLVHESAARNVIMAESDRITHTTIERAKALLGLPELPARELYARSAATPPHRIAAKSHLATAQA
jgi:hypothetical protein